MEYTLELLSNYVRMYVAVSAPKCLVQERREMGSTRSTRIPHAIFRTCTGSHGDVGIQAVEGCGDD